MSFIPVLPVTIVNHGAAVSAISRRDFLVGTTIGIAASASSGGSARSEGGSDLRRRWMARPTGGRGPTPARRMPVHPSAPRPKETPVTRFGFTLMTEQNGPREL